MKTIKNIFRVASVAFMVIIINQGVTAQYGMGTGSRKFQENKEKIRSHKIAFITDKLDLSPGEAEKFWPVYNNYEEQKESSAKEFAEKYRDKVKRIPELSEAESEELITARLEHKQQMLDLEINFITKLKSILPSNKILLLMEAERDFRVELMKKLAGNKGPGPGSKRPR
ncbi:MAG: hypothetical protein B6D61_05575 [Bacteroidetes bacterium 4484_249]|nr:MAG: hypothetical protein B6D61_05575 [Bacteroidetes bacterium 4484_249]